MHSNTCNEPTAGWHALRKYDRTCVLCCALQCKYRYPWFQALAWTEVALQLPFFFVAAYAFARAREWIRTPSIIYGLCTATTLVPIFGELYYANSPEYNKYILLGFYVPFFVVPLAIAVRALRRPRLFQAPVKDSFKII